MNTIPPKLKDIAVKMYDMYKYVQICKKLENKFSILYCRNLASERRTKKFCGCGNYLRP